MKGTLWCQNSNPAYAVKSMILNRHFLKLQLLRHDMRCVLMFVTTVCFFIYRGSSHLISLKFCGCIKIDGNNSLGFSICCQCNVCLHFWTSLFTSTQKDACPSGQRVRFETCFDHFLELLNGSPNFKSSATLVNNQLTNATDFGQSYAQFELFVSEVCLAPLIFVL